MTYFIFTYLPFCEIDEQNNIKCGPHMGFESQKKKKEKDWLFCCRGK